MKYYSYTNPHSALVVGIDEQSADKAYKAVYADTKEAEISKKEITLEEFGAEGIIVGRGITVEI